jgi:hypothetical protein
MKGRKRDPHRKTIQVHVIYETTGPKVVRRSGVIGFPVHSRHGIKSTTGKDLLRFTDPAEIPALIEQAFAREGVRYEGDE